MKLLDLLKLSTRMFKTRPTRTWLTILGVGVGIGAVLFLISLGYGIQKLVFEQIVTDEALLSLTVFSPNPEAIVLNPERAEALSRLERVEKVSPLVALPAQIELKDLNANVTLKGVNPSYFRYAGIVPKQGDFFKIGEKKIVVSEAIPKLFNIEEPKKIIGKELKIRIFAPAEESEEITAKQTAESYKISGITEGPQSIFIYFPLSDVQHLVKIKQYEEVKVKVKQDSDLEAVREEIIGQGFRVSSLTETLDQANKIFGWVRIGLGFLGAIALFVAAIGMINTMVVALLERTQEIGIMRAIGASRKDIKFLFIQEATIMGFLGGLAGIGIGVLSGVLFNWLLNILATAFGGKAVSIFVYPVWFMVTIIFVSTALGFISGFFPARKAARLDPLDALRYK